MFLRPFMTTDKLLPRAFLFSFSLLLCGIVEAQTPSFDGFVQQPRILRNRPAEIRLLSGVRIFDTEIEAFLTDRKTGAIDFVQYADGRRKPKKKASEVYSIKIEGRPYRFRYHAPSDGLYLIDHLAAIGEAMGRLEGMGKELRKIQDEDESDEAVEEHKTFLRSSLKKMALPNIQIHESEFGLIVCKGPPEAAKFLGNYVDETCRRMNSLFRLPEDTNVWHGKAIVFASTEQRDYASFETNAMNNPNFGSSSFLYHGSPKRFVIACYGKSLNKGIAKNICWAIAGGYLGRTVSNADLPVWLQTGARGWVSSAMFPDSKSYNRNKSRFSSELRSKQSLLGILDATDIAMERRFLTVMLVNHLIKLSPQAFGQFFNDIKLGTPQGEALKNNFGLEEAAFVEQFGLGLGIRGLQK